MQNQKEPGKPGMRARADHWRAADYTTPYGRQAGRVHVLSSDGQQTRCGKPWSTLGGGATTDPATCKVCISSVAGEATRAEAQAAAIARQAEYQSKIEAENAAWWAWYNDYLLSPAWREKSAAVIRRAGGVCEACGTARATQAHHVTYRHVGAEPLFDLRAVCRPCHDRITEMDRKPGERPA